MKTSLSLAVFAAIVVGMTFVGGASADPAAACKASLDEPGVVPPGVSRTDMEAGCDCIVEAAAGDAELLAEIEAVSQMTDEERLVVMSDKLTKVSDQCFPS